MTYPEKEPWTKSKAKMSPILSSIHLHHCLWPDWIQFSLSNPRSKERRQYSIPSILLPCVHLMRKTMQTPI